MGSNTDTLSLYKPDPGEDDWGSDVNDSFDTLDNAVLQEVKSITSDTTLSRADVALVDASGGAVTVTLPSVSDILKVNVKKTDSSSNAVTIATPNTETIDGNSSLSITGEYISRTIVSDGSDYFIV